LFFQAHYSSPRSSYWYRRDVLVSLVKNIENWWTIGNKVNAVEEQNGDLECFDVENWLPAVCRLATALSADLIAVGCGCTIETKSPRFFQACEIAFGSREIFWRSMRLL